MTMKPLIRSYTPTAEDFARCLACGRDCMPFPHRDSGSCTVCWYLDVLDRILRDIRETP